MSTRKAVFAGRFYPDGREACEGMLDDLLKNAALGDGVAAIVPHAGWVYSGACAGLGIGSIAGSKPDTVVVFGAAHVLARTEAVLSPDETWRTPVGEIKVDMELMKRVLSSRSFLVDGAAHNQEHSIEVELPFVQRLMPGARFLPVIVRPGQAAAEIGRRCAVEALELGRRVVFIGSTDLTHYGPAYGFEPAGRGAGGIRWAKEVNDRSFVDLIAAMQASELVAHAEAHRNACGAGAVAATVGAAAALGATRYEELEHTTSAESGFGRELAPANSVGYEAGVFRRPDKTTVSRETA